MHKKEKYMANLFLDICQFFPTSSLLCSVWAISLWSFQSLAKSYIHENNKHIVSHHSKCSYPGDQIVAPAMSVRSFHYRFLLLTVWSHKTQLCHCLSLLPVLRVRSDTQAFDHWRIFSKSLHRCSAACFALIPITRDLWINLATAISAWVWLWDSPCFTPLIWVCMFLFKKILPFLTNCERHWEFH